MVNLSLSFLVVTSVLFLYFNFLSKNSFDLVEQRDSLNMFLQKDIQEKEKYRRDVEILIAELLKKESVEAGELYILAKQLKIANEYKFSSKIFASIYSKFGRELDGAILAEYAEVLFLSKERNFDKLTKDLLDQALGKNPNNPSALTLKGLSLLELGDVDGTIELWTKALLFLNDEKEKNDLKNLINAVKNQKNK